MTCEQKWKDLCLKRDQVDFIEGKIRSKLHTWKILSERRQQMGYLYPNVGLVGNVFNSTHKL